MTFAMDDRRGFANMVARKFDKFWQLKLPCPVDPVEDIYRRAFTDKEWVAMRYLMQEKPKVIKNDGSFNLFWTDDTTATHKCPHVTFTFDGLRLPEFPVRLDGLPDPIQGKVRDWITSVNYFRMLREQLLARVKGVMGNPTGEGNRNQTRTYRDLDPCVNTPKQLYRLWPEIFPLMHKHWKREVQLGSAKSRLPYSVAYRVERDGGQGFRSKRWAKPEEFRCEDAEATEYEKRSFQQINEIITMLSIAGDVAPPSNYPTFCGPL